MEAIGWVSRAWRTQYVRALIGVSLACSVVWIVAEQDLPETFAYDVPVGFPPPRAPPAFKFTSFLQARLLSNRNRTSYPVTLPVVAQNLSLSDLQWLENPENSLFGTIIVFDASLTSGILANSTEVGRARGLFVFDLQNDVGPTKGVEYVFTAIFNVKSGFGNSTLCLKGWQFTYEDNTPSQLVICGGTGVFTLARGYADISTERLATAGDPTSYAAFKIVAHLYF